MTFLGYQTATSGQSIYEHAETTTIAGTSYYLQKLASADGPATSLSASMATTGRQLWGKFVYPLTGVSSIPASTWTIYYREWYSGVTATGRYKFPKLNLWSMDDARRRLRRQRNLCLHH